LVTYEGDEEVDEIEERFDFMNDMYKTSSSFAANAYDLTKIDSELGKSMSSFNGDNQSMLSKS
jgi:hypothetical protein